MAVDNYLIIGINPANNEINVSTDSDIVLSFSKNMDQTSLGSANIILKEVNGDIVTVPLNYIGITKTLIIMSKGLLRTGTTYELIVTGGENGIKTITNDHMSISRTYQFTTASTVGLSIPTNVSVTLNNRFPTVQWTPPVNHDSIIGITYEVKIGTTNLATDVPIWPATGDINKTSSTVINIPKQLSQGIYYAYVRAINGEQVTEWTPYTEFYVEAQTTSTPSPSDGATTSYILDVVETYPKDGAADIVPEKIIILFSDNVDLTTINNNTVYVVPKVKNGTLTTIDLMMDFSPSKAIGVSIDAVTGPTNIITLTPSANSIVDDTEYTVIVRDSIKSVNGASIGETFTFTFMSNYSRLYGDVELVRHDIGSTVDNLTDRIIYKFMSDNSEQAYRLVSLTSGFTATDYANGAAPYHMHQYVRYRTSYDLLLNAQLHSTSGTGDGFTSSITLGDLTVKKVENAAGSVSSILVDLQSKMKNYLDQLYGQHNRGYAKPVTVSRGENVEAYPDFLTRADFHDLGS